MNKKYLVVIPARGGSKRLPRKNILPLAGKPLISWTIEAALNCDAIGKIVISSDDDEILAIATRYKVDVLKRPEHLASDTSTSLDAIKHTIENNAGYEYIVLLQPTSPLRTAKHLKEAIHLLEEKQADAVISVCETEHSPLWANTLPEDKNMQGFLREELLNTRSQDLPTYYRLNGAIYICKIEKLLQENSFFIKKNICAYVMDKTASIDIDDALDFELAKVLMQQRAASKT